ncbi:MAG: hypothetical protein IJB04_06425 [Oscillospiraceae bacterium]|nr:hypothetical protein [Oscillospiraceae bacterium]
MRMTVQEKITAIESAIRKSHPDIFYHLLEDLGDMKYRYWDYMTTEPIDCDTELKRLNSANYELCTALLTMLLREDHFCNGMFEERCEAGQVEQILKQMIASLNNA